MANQSPKNFLALMFFLIVAGYFAFNAFSNGNKSKEWDMTHLAIAPATEKFVETYFDQAAQTRELIRNGSFAEADKVINEIMASSKMGEWSYSPFSEYIWVVVPAEDDLFLSQLNKWAEQEPKSATPYLLRGIYYRNLGWKIRGTDFANTVKDEDMKLFGSYLIAALEQVNYAIYLNPDFPYPYSFANSMTKAFPKNIQDEIYKISVSKFPNYYSLYSSRLQQLTPKWGGSYFEMLEFIKKNTKDIAADSPLNMLILDGYADLLDNFDIYCKESHPSVKPENAKKFCHEQRKRIFASDEVKQELAKVFKLYNDKNAYEFNEYLAENGNPDSFALYETAWPIIGDKHYGLNHVIGEYFMSGAAKAEYYDDALYFYKKALDDARKFNFPNEAAKNSAIAKIYSALASSIAISIVYLDKNAIAEYESLRSLNKKDAVDYAQHALKLTPNNPYVLDNICAVYYTLKQNEDTLKYCQRAIDINNSYKARHILKLMKKQTK